MENETFHRRKGTLMTFSQSSDIDELVLMVLDVRDGYMLLSKLSGLELGSDRICFLFGFLLSWNRVLSYVFLM